METVVEEPQFAGLPEQKLPVSGRMLPGSDAKGALLPVVEVTHEALGNQTGRSGNGRGESGHLAASPISVADSFSGPLVAATEASPVTRTMENLASSLSREVAQFKRFNAESMAVVLKPDAQTEIFLHLVSRQGQVEMQARFERGDFQAVNGQWSQLQQSLSLHGVRLGALQEGFNQPSGNPSSAGAEWGHGQLPGQHRQPSGQGGRGESTLEFSQEADRLSEQPRFAKPSAPVRRNVRRVTLEAWA